MGTVKVLERIGKSYSVEDQDGLEHRVQIRSTTPSPSKTTPSPSKPTPSKTTPTTSTLTTCTFDQGPFDEEAADWEMDAEEAEDWVLAGSSMGVADQAIVDGYTAGLAEQMDRVIGETAGELDVLGLNVQSTEGQTALMVAAEGYVEVVEALLKAGGNAIDHSLVNANGYTSLMLAAQSNQIDIVNALIAARTKQINDDVTVTSSTKAQDSKYGFSITGITGAKGPYVNGHYKKTSKVVHGKPVYEKVDDATKQCFFDVHKRWMVGDTKKVKEGASTGFAHTVAKHLTSPVGSSAEWKAYNSTAKKWDPIASVTVTSIVVATATAADPFGLNLQTVNGTTAIMYAADGGNLEVIEALLKAGGDDIDHSLVDSCGFTALMQAAGANQIDVVNALVAARQEQAKQEQANAF